MVLFEACLASVASVDFLQLNIIICEMGMYACGSWFFMLASFSIIDTRDGGTEFGWHSGGKDHGNPADFTRIIASPS